VAKTVIIYYSFTNNTKMIAEKIQQAKGYEAIRIDTVTPYTGDYNDIVNQGQDEVENSFKPEIAPAKIDLSQYDTIILGTPVWWYSVAPAVLTFLTSQNFSGKTIIPFATNGGWLGHTMKDIQKICKGATVENTMSIPFSEDKLNVPENDLKHWIESL
jgi:flavodoxin